MNMILVEISYKYHISVMNIISQAYGYLGIDLDYDTLLDIADWYRGDGFITKEVEDWCESVMSGKIRFSDDRRWDK